MPRIVKKPSYLLHKATGQARCRIAGQDIYLGEYGSTASRHQYDQLMREWFARQDVSRVTHTIADICLLYIEHAETYYRKGGKPTSELNNVRIALRPLIRLYRSALVSAFAPTDLKRVREEMIQAGCVRSSINRQIDRIKRMFRWGVEEGTVPPEVYAGVAALSGLRAGRSAAKESEPVRPVALAAVEAIKPHVSRQVWAMVQLQLLTGMRPGEVVTMRACDLNVGSAVWEYVPAAHKTEHHGRKRVIFLGPQAQDVVREFLKSDLSASLFSPAEARAEFQSMRKANRKTPLTPSQRARKRKSHPRKEPGASYTVCSYGAAIRKACEEAFLMPRELRNIKKNVKEPERSNLRQQAHEWRKQHCWHPHQLRHNAGTSLRREFGIEAARTVLGHASAGITEIYAERDLDVARAVAAKIG